MAARSLWEREVVGSIPTSPTGNEFHHPALVAQWIEHSTSDRGVAGSNPAEGASRLDGSMLP